MIGTMDPLPRPKHTATSLIGDTTDKRTSRVFWSERLVDYQRPYAVVFLDDLPRNAMGKVMRRELRERLEE